MDFAVHLFLVTGMVDDTVADHGVECLIRKRQGFDVALDKGDSCLAGLDFGCSCSVLSGLFNHGSCEIETDGQTVRPQGQRCLDRFPAASAAQIQDGLAGHKIQIRQIATAAQIAAGAAFLRIADLDLVFHGISLQGQIEGLAAARL